MIMTENELIKEILQESLLEKCSNTKKAQQLPPPPLEKPVPAGTSVIPLPEPDLLPDQQINFLELIEVRATVRQYSNQEITLKELSYMLWCTQGVKMALPKGGTMRTVPSAGARHAFETYLLVHRVEGLKPGLYRFLALGHALLPIDTAEGALEKFYPGFKAANMVKNSAVTFIWAADFPRMTYMFGNRACRYIYLDAGHVCQNLYLADHTLRIGTCAVGAFFDDKLNAALGFDGENDFVVYCATTGKP